MKRTTLLTLSVTVHVAAAVGLGAIQVHRAVNPTPIELMDVKPPPDPPEKKAEPEPPPPPKAPPPRRPSPVSELEEAPSPDVDTDTSFSNVPDFGLALSGGVDIGGGIAVPVNRSSRRMEPPRAVKQLTAAPERTTSGVCPKAPSKPRPLSVPRPEYPEQARQAGVEGKVRLVLTVATSGDVTDVRVLQSLGHGIDAAAIAAAQRARFEPARACGRAAVGTFTIAMRFSAG